MLFFAFYFLQTPEKACMKVLTKQKQQAEQYLLQILSQEFCGFLYMFFHRTGLNMHSLRYLFISHLFKVRQFESLTTFRR